MDEWRVDSIETTQTQHRTLSERKEAAHILMNKYPLHPQITLVLDNMDNAFNRVFPSWPFRYWMRAADGRLAGKCMPEGDKVSLTALSDWLQSL